MSRLPSRRRPGAGPAIAVALALAVVGPSRAEETARLPKRSIMLVIDTSAPMAEHDDRRVLRKALGRVIESLRDDDAVGLLTFDSYARTIASVRPLGEPRVREDLLEEVGKLEFEGLRAKIPEAIEKALQVLRPPGQASTPGLIVLVTNGIVDTGDGAGNDSREATLREDLLPTCRSADVRIHLVTFAETADYDLLSAMAVQTGGSYNRAVEPVDVPAIFKSLESALRFDEPSNKVLLSPSAIAAIALTAVGLLVGAFALLRHRRGRRGDDDEIPLTEAVLHDLSDGSRFPLSRRVTRVGRAADNDLVLDSRTISGRQASIEARGGVYRLTDLGSTNGTFVNGKLIKGETSLCRGDILRFDRFKYAFDGVPMDESWEEDSVDFDKTQNRRSPWSESDDDL